jgi:excisionase family DNA binding protein
MQSRISLETPEMSIEKYAEKLGVSLDTVRGWIKTGKLPTYKLGKRRMVNLVVRAQECLDMGQYDPAVMPSCSTAEQGAHQ